jgi:ferredoxin--NADP+ reductase
MRLVVQAPRVAAHARPGQFVILRLDDSGERIPLTICDSDAEDGSITLVVQAVGSTTTRLCEKASGDHLADVVGPLGKPTNVQLFGSCAVVAGGVGAAIMLPVARALQACGNDVIGFIGARDSTHLLLIDELEATCHGVETATEDGSAGTTGFVTKCLGAHLATTSVDRVFTAGPVPMMAAVAETTRPHGIPTIASLNPIMVDGTGMCGGCRVRVAGETRFACVDGPEFDGHDVDFDSLQRRNDAYQDFEYCRLQAVDADG